MKKEIKQKTSNGMKFHIITLFPESFSYLNTSLLGRAQEKKKISVRFANPRDFTTDKHKTVDEKSYGGGPGMVMKAEPVLKAVQKSLKSSKSKKIKVIFFAPDGKQFTNAYADKLLKNYSDVVLISGHYEGIDERVAKILKAQKVSVGPYVLTGGELPAMVVVDAMTRRIPGVLGTRESLEELRSASSEVYTRPESFQYKGKKYSVPKVLLSGDHKKIEAWRSLKKGDRTER